MLHARRVAKSPLRWIGAAVLAFATTFAHAAEGDDAREWLKRMSDSLGAYDYEGVFVYAHDGRIETIQVKRTTTAQGPKEHLVSLTGDRREVLRDGTDLRCIFPNGIVATLRSETLPASNNGAIDADRFASASSQYQLSIVGDDRVAGYDAAVLDARPTDAMRYGYRLWLERETGMLVGSKRVAPDGSTVEEMMFTQLALKPVAARAPAPPSAAPLPTMAGGPTFADPGLPAGFRLVASPPVDGGRRHFVYSDGLANVSLYVEPLLEGARPMNGSANRGAVHVFGRVSGPKQIVVVGDVPAATAQRIAVTVDPASADQPIP